MQDINNFIKNRDLEKCTINEKIQYFNTLKAQCEKLSSSKYKHFIHNFVINVYPYLRDYDYEIEGISNIPDNGNCLFMLNHSNSHDIFSVLEIFNQLGLKISPFVASDDLTFATNFLFSSCDAVLLDRRDKQSTSKAILEFSSKIIHGTPGAIFGEATWNLHPVKPMQTLKIGGAQIAAIAEAPIVPCLLEYIEVPYLCDNESELYKKCIVRFLEPIYITRSESLIYQTNLIQQAMERSRIALWKELGIYRNSLKDIDKMIYLNHTYLKKFKAFGFTYDAENEAKYLFSKDGNPVENEYRLDECGQLVPGSTGKKEGKAYLKKNITLHK